MNTLIHVQAQPCAAPGLLVPFLTALLTVIRERETRASWLPRYAMTPKQVGFVEIGSCVALLGAIALRAG
jgi:hypothetical protein